MIDVNSNTEYETLAANLKKSGIAATEMDAKRMAQEMIQGTKKVVTQHQDFRNARSLHSTLGQPSLTQAAQDVGEVHKKMQQEIASLKDELTLRDQKIEQLASQLKQMESEQQYDIAQEQEFVHDQQPTAIEQQPAPVTHVNNDFSFAPQNQVETQSPPVQEYNPTQHEEFSIEQSTSPSNSVLDSPQPLSSLIEDEEKSQAPNVDIQRTPPPQVPQVEMQSAMMPEQELHPTHEQSEVSSISVDDDISAQGRIDISHPQDIESIEDQEIEHQIADNLFQVEQPTGREDFAEELLDTHQITEDEVMVHRDVEQDLQAVESHDSKDQMEYEEEQEEIGFIGQDINNENSQIDTNEDAPPKAPVNRLSQEEKDSADLSQIFNVNK